MTDEQQAQQLIEQADRISAEHRLLKEMWRIVDIGHADYGKANFDDYSNRLPGKLGDRFGDFRERIRNVGNAADLVAHEAMSDAEFSKFWNRKHKK
jgi:hypothetical protein